MSGKLPAIPYTRPKTKDGFFRKSEYIYDEYFDCYLCPQNQILKYTTTNREGYREYKSDPRVCENCPFRENCTLSKNKTKVVIRHVLAKLSRVSKSQSASSSYFLLPQFEKIGKEKASRFYIFLLHFPPLKKIKKQSPSQAIPKRVLSTS